MELTVRELAALVGGQFAAEADGAKRISGAAALAEAVEGDVSFFGNAKYLPQLKASGATAVLVPTEFREPVAPVVIRVENPSLAFAQLLAKFAPEPPRFAPGVHPSAVLGKGVKLGANVSVQPCAVIEDGVEIGANTVIGAQTYLGHGARIGADCQLAARVTVAARCWVGDRVILHSGVVVGSDGFGFEPSGGRHVKIPQIGIVRVDDDVEIGANTTVDRARFGRTWIGEGTKIDNLVQIGHNVVIGRHCIIVAQTAIAGSTRLGNHVTVGGQAAFVGHIEVGDNVTVAARSGVSKNVEAKQILWGSPAVPIREAKEQMAAARRLPKLLARLKRLEQIVGPVPNSASAESNS
ncbi:MAG TPA: UDP-3-O-(3-hydroxymyristoyl)glucosamine N-acyltransferase [Chthoniobacteraceae bacterium]